MSWVLDTNVISELRKIRSGKADCRVAEWVSGLRPGQLFLSVVTLHELEHGVLLAEHNDPAQGAVLRRWLDESVTAAFDRRVLPIDEVIARRAAALHVPDPAPFRDALIAATALEHGMRVATRNVRDFQRFAGLTVVNPWQ